ncbi:MAG: glucuronate isomerase [Kiritimatiellia bacterium]|nr:glucuronate isomerase [Lentisphaerota bacterium]
MDKSKIREVVEETVRRTAITDIHTHTFDPAMGGLLLWGIDELLTYHYLVAEVFRARPDMAYSDFMSMAKPAQADIIWDELFVKRSPVSEACRGVVTVLHSLGLDTGSRDLRAYRAYFSGQNVRDYVERVFETAGIRKVYMTNDPMDPAEGPLWEKGFDRDSRFLGVLRLDSALINWPEGAARLQRMGYRVDSSLSGSTIKELRRYLNEWCDKIDARYMAISMPPEFRYPDVESSLTTLMIKAVVPVARERNIPVAMMIGVRKLVNPELTLAGDSVGCADVATVEALARDFGDVRFMVTMLARENMHALCVAARKFKNMLPFGCWWFLNNPSLVREITAMRLELLGLSCIPQHSDSRVLDQLIYKWTHSRQIIGEVLGGKYADLARSGWVASRQEIERDVNLLFDGRSIE